VGLPSDRNAKKVIEYVMEESRDFTHTFIGTARIMLGYLRTESVSLNNALAKQFLTADAVRDKIMKSMPEGNPSDLND
jgi:hypothetical protein